jgi:hypothetical protein
MRSSDITALPALDLRALAQRAALAGALTLVAVVLLVVAGGPLQAFADALQRAIDADPRWIGAAVVFELAIWLPAPLGLVALGNLRRTFARWAEEDAAADAPAGRRMGSGRWVPSGAAAGRVAPA